MTHRHDPEAHLNRPSYFARKAEKMVLEIGCLVRILEGACELRSTDRLFGSGEVSDPAILNLYQVYREYRPIIKNAKAPTSRNRLW